MNCNTFDRIIHTSNCTENGVHRIHDFTPWTMIASQSVNWVVPFWMPPLGHRLLDVRLWLYAFSFLQFKRLTLSKIPFTRSWSRDKWALRGRKLTCALSSLVGGSHDNRNPARPSLFTIKRRASNILHKLLSWHKVNSAFELTTYCFQYIRRDVPSFLPNSQSPYPFLKEFSSPQTVSCNSVRSSVQDPVPITTITSPNDVSSSLCYFLFRRLIDRAN